jgi:hypothetical protein
MRTLIFLAATALIAFSCNNPDSGKSDGYSSKPIEERINDRDFPSVFMAWYGIDMPDMYPLTTNEDRLRAAAKHDLLWEEPLSQLGEGYDLTLGLVWDHKHHGLATTFTAESLREALANRDFMLKQNPNMVFLMEIRWRDAPMSFLPEESNWWLRNDEGEIVKGWLGGWEPFYKLDFNNSDFQDNTATQSRIAIESGVYDGIMLDWSGNLEIIKKIRAAIGPKALIIVNIHDDIEDGMKYAPYINGSFMELNPVDSISIPVAGVDGNILSDRNPRHWDNIRNALIWFENNLLEPRINCNEVWGNRNDLPRMRAVTTMTLVYSNGYVLYADPNPLATPDHLHDWYPFWDIPLGKPVGPYTEKEDGSAWREYDGGTVVYNHYSNPAITIRFDEDRRRASDGTVAREFTINRRDGDIFIKN